VSDVEEQMSANSGCSPRVCLMSEVEEKEVSDVEKQMSADSACPPRVCV